MGTDHLINFRNAPLKNDCELKTNVWHDMEFSRKDGIVSITADGNLIRTVESDESLFIIRVYNDSREVNISEFHATVEPAKNEGKLASRVEYLENNYKDEVSSLKKELEQYKISTDRILDPTITYSIQFTWIMI